MPELLKDVLKGEAYKHDIPDELLDRIYREYEVQADNTLYSAQVSTGSSMPACLLIRPVLNRRNATLNIIQPSPLSQVTQCQVDSSDESIMPDETPGATGIFTQQASSLTFQERRAKRHSQEPFRISFPPRPIYIKDELKESNPDFKLQHAPQPHLGPLDNEDYKCDHVTCSFDEWEKYIDTQSQPAKVDPLANPAPSAAVNEGPNKLLNTRKNSTEANSLESGAPHLKQ